MLGTLVTVMLASRNSLSQYEHMENRVNQTYQRRYWRFDQENEGERKRETREGVFGKASHRE
jgi:hypothetical protein